MNEKELLSKYAESHQHAVNQKVHLICVPVIFFSLLAILYALLPVIVYVIINAMIMGFYFKKLPHLFFPMFAFLFALNLAVSMLATIPYFVPLNVGLFVLGWMGQFWGHKIEGKRPAFFEDLFFLLVGPAWVILKLRKK